MRTRPALATVVIVIVGLTGCARPEIVGFGADSPAVDSGPVGVSCSGDPFNPREQPAPVALPASFVPVAATRCVFTMETVPGDGEWSVRIDQRTEGDLSALAAALREPSGKPGPNTICTLIAYAPIVVTLVDATGAKVTPTAPTTECQAPMPAVVAAIQALPWQDVARTRVSQVRSQLEIDTNCPSGYKPVVGLLAAEAGRKPPAAGPAFPSTPAALQVCRFALSPDDTISTGTVELKIGKLTTAPVLEGPALTQFLAALAAAPPVTATCDAPQPEFAVLFPKGEGAGSSIAVETGGCYRALDPNDGLRQLDAATVALLPA
jgi:hypothetical protein